MHHQHHGNDKVVTYLRRAQAQEEARITGIRARLERAEEGPYREDLERHASQVMRHGWLLEERLGALGEDGLPDLFGLATGAILEIGGRGLRLFGATLHLLHRDEESPEEETLKGAEREALAATALIATYLALERIAANTGDVETAHIAREIRKEEEAMLQRLGDHIPELAGRTTPPQVTEVKTTAATG
jgi:hypothetical protein